MTTTTAVDHLDAASAQLWAALDRIDALLARSAELLAAHDTHEENQ